MKKDNKKAHNKAVDEILCKPSIIGLEKVVLGAKEVDIYDYSGRLIGKPDLVFRDSLGYWHIVEYKCGESKVEKAMDQLSRASDHFAVYNIDKMAKLYYVFGNMVVKEVT